MSAGQLTFLEPSIARAARAHTGLTQIGLGRAAGLASRTVHKLEKDGWITEESMMKILAALSREGIVMLRDEKGVIYGCRGPERS